MGFFGRGGNAKVTRSSKGIVTKKGFIGENEVECQSEASELGISPSIHSYDHNSITMDEVQGQTLFDIGSLTPEQYKQLEKKIGKAHAKRLFHNDLSNANIMIDDKGEVHIIDWGSGTTMFPDPTRISDEKRLNHIKRNYVNE